MKRIIFLWLICFSMVCLVSCRKTEYIPTGVVATEAFVVNEYLQNGAVYQQKSTFEITGTAEVGVVIVVSLRYNGIETLAQAYGIADEFGKWHVALTAPKGSYRTYQIDIMDGNKIYQKQYDKIQFGEVWMLAGEGFLTEPLEYGSVAVDNMQYLSFYLQTTKGGRWLNPLTDQTSISSLALLYGIKLQQKYHVPVAMIQAQEEQALMDEWLDRSSIEHRKMIKEALISLGRYVEEGDEHAGSMSHLYKHKIAALEGLKLGGVLWYQGISDVLQANEQNINGYFAIYQMMLMTLIEDWSRYFGENNHFCIIQEPASTIKNVEKLRLSQSTISYYFTNAVIVPTYDLNEVFVKIGNDEIPLEDYSGDIETIISQQQYRCDNLKMTDLVTRIYQIVENHQLASGYANLIIERNEENVTVKIMIQFSNTTLLQIPDEKMRHFYIYDKLGNIIPITPLIDRNNLIINLQKSETKAAVVPTYWEIGRIEYANTPNNRFANLYNHNGIPVVPFVINVK